MEQNKIALKTLTILTQLNYPITPESFAAVWEVVSKSDGELDVDVVINHLQNKSSDGKEEREIDLLTGLFNGKKLEKDLSSLNDRCLILFKLDEDLPDLEKNRVYQSFARLLASYPLSGTRYRNGKEFALLVEGDREKALWKAEQIKQIWDSEIISAMGKSFKIPVFYAVECWREADYKSAFTVYANCRKKLNDLLQRRKAQKQ